MRAALLVVLLLCGCATEFSGVCAIVPIGQNEAGVAFARVQCEVVK